MKEKTPKVVPFFVLSSVTLILWAFFDIYRNFKKEPPAVVPPEVIVPLNPKLDIAVLDKLGDRFYMEDSEIENTIYTSTNTPKATSTAKAKSSPTPIASQSASPTPTVSASEVPE